MPAKEENERLTELAIADRNGKNYRLIRWEYRESCNWSIYDDRIPVGHSYCLNESPVFRLNDITLESNVVRSRCRLVASIQHKFGIEPKTVTYRGRGLGSALLKVIGAYAKSQGFQTVTGEIFPKDYNENARLPEWYQAHGFTFERSLQNQGTIGRVSFSLT